MFCGCGTNGLINIVSIGYYYTTRRLLWYKLESISNATTKNVDNLFLEHSIEGYFFTNKYFVLFDCHFKPFKNFNFIEYRRFDLCLTTNGSI